MDIKAVLQRVKKKKVSELGGNRRANDIQSKIESAHNSGNAALASQLIGKLPSDLRSGMTYTGHAVVDPITHKISVRK